MLIYLAAVLPALISCMLNFDIISLSYIIYITWLMTIAYTDYVTGYVYNCMEYVSIIPVLMITVSLLIKCINLKIVSLNNSFCAVLVSFIIVAAVIKILGSNRCIGEGDTDIIIISLIMIICRYIDSDIELLYCLYSHVFVKCLVFQIQYIYIILLLFFVRYFSKIRWKHLKLDCNKPLTPSIYMASVLYMLI